MSFSHCHCHPTLISFLCACGCFISLILDSNVLRRIKFPLKPGKSRSEIPSHLPPTPSLGGRATLSISLPSEWVSKQVSSVVVRWGASRSHATGRRTSWSSHLVRGHTTRAHSVGRGATWLPHRSWLAALRYWLAHWSWLTLVHWLTHWLAHWSWLALVHWLAHRSWLTHWLTHWLTLRTYSSCHLLIRSLLSSGQNKRYKVRS